LKNSTANKKKGDLKNVTVNINGRDYKIESVRDPEYTRKLAKYCDLLMKQIESATTSTNYVKLTVLTMMQLAHNYFQSEENGSTHELETEVERLINVMDKTEKELAAIDVAGGSAK